MVWGQELAVNPPRFLGKPFEESRCLDDLTVGLSPRLALFRGDRPGEIVLMPEQQFTPLPDNRPALLGRQRTPAIDISAVPQRLPAVERKRRHADALAVPFNPGSPVPPGVSALSRAIMPSSRIASDAVKGTRMRIVWPN